ncbi:MAG: FG-GAP repeat protein, partial [Planctomycetes bacterium]|nr:FG-GAP repeat protein [Planctomycetota bacterium]
NGVSEADQSGWSVSAAGDVNGDGLDDLIVGARLDDPNGSNSGASFVVFGGDFSGAATQVGTIGDDTLTGSAAADVLIGGTGADYFTARAARMCCAAARATMSSRSAISPSPSSTAAPASTPCASTAPG